MNTVAETISNPSSNDVLRIGVITAIPTPYRDPFWNAIAADPGTCLHVYYCAATTADRPWNPLWRMRYDHEFLPGYNLLRPFPSKGSCYWNPGIVRRLAAERHDALIVGGYNYPTMMSAMRYAHRRKIPYFLMSESHLREPRAAWRRVAKEPIIRAIVRNAAGCLPTGTWAREYLLHYGAEPERLTFFPNVPDVEALDRQAQELVGRQPEVRRDLGLGESPVVLYVGRLVEFKRVDLLIEAFAKVVPYSSARLAIVGDGLQRSLLESLVQRLGLADRVLFRGFVEPDMVARWYAAADVLVLPSVGETWSVAVLESLASGLPVVTTDTVGAAADAINDPAVGSIVPTGDVNALAEAIRTRLAAGTNRNLVRARWSPMRERFRYEAVARDLLHAVRRAVAQQKAGHVG